MSLSKLPSQCSSLGEDHEVSLPLNCLPGGQSGCGGEEGHFLRLCAAPLAFHHPRPARPGSQVLCGVAVPRFVGHISGGASGGTPCGRRADLGGGVFLHIVESQDVPSCKSQGSLTSNRQTFSAKSLCCAH